MTNVLAYIGRNTYELYRYFAGLYEITAKAVLLDLRSPLQGEKPEVAYVCRHARRNVEI
jgi:hypothetical protein